ncbi:MAG: hypothetical protein HY717_19840 [Planctomycetes bacterium]|nr:hypothetical protein [Planctomycetota bacterium]
MNLRYETPLHKLSIEQVAARILFLDLALTSASCLSSSPREQIRPDSADQPEAAECLSCHGGLNAGLFIGAHRRGGLECRSCHSQAPNHQTAKPAGPAMKKNLSPEEAQAVESKCRRCHSQVKSAGDLSQGYRRWRHTQGTGLYGGKEKKCFECHHH